MKTQIAILLFSALFISFLACKKNNSKADSQEKIIADDATEQFFQQGEQIAATLTNAWGSQVQKVLQQNDVATALPYCTINGLSVADSLQNLNGVAIRRISQRPRNLENQPNTIELLLLRQIVEIKNSGMEIKPVRHQIDEYTVALLVPIFAEKNCLSCHGKVGDDIKAEDYAVIKQQYPKDQAINYKAGDLMGGYFLSFRGQ